MITILTRFSYPKQPGDSPWSIADVEGPKSYVQITPGSPGPPPTPPSGGQPLFPADFALQSFDIVIAGMASFDGKFAVEAIPLLTPPAPMDDVFQKFLLMWIDLSTMQQATTGQDLSKSSVRLLAIGH